MTRVECLNKTMAVWGYLVEHPWDTKQDAYVALNLEQDLYCCPCCGFAEYDGHPYCPDCPLKMRWMGGNGMPGCPTHYCIADGSIYTQWRYAGSAGKRRKMAAKIEAMAYAELTRGGQEHESIL